jgi:GGDEF domain-containing protein
MRNNKCERIKAHANHLKRGFSDQFCHDQCNKVIKDVGRLDRTLLTFTEINQLIRLIHMYKQLDGYYHEMSDQVLDGIENRLQGLMDDSMITQYERKK